MTASSFAFLPRAVSRASAIACILLAALLAIPEAQAQQRFGEAPRYRVESAPTHIAPEDICVLHPGEAVPAAKVKARAFLRGPAYQRTANFEVTYNGFDGAEGQQAQEAFQRAVDIWAQHIESPVTIKVDASFSPLGENVLGSAGPNSLWFLIPDDAPAGIECTDPAQSGVCTIYGDALADAVLGENAADDPNAPDIIANFSEDANWYYGTGDPAAGQIDFTSVVLHELAHGLGFFGSMAVEDPDSSDADAAEQGLWPYDVTNPSVPVIYDRFTEDGSGTALLNTSAYPNPSVDLRQVLTSDAVFFNGPNAVTGNGGEVPPLYAPSPWSQGSSYSHLDEFTYPVFDFNPDDGITPDTLNALMTPQIGFREVIQSPGSITCGMFMDLGWELGPACEALLRSDVASLQAEYLPERGTVRVTWITQPTSEAEGFTLLRGNFTYADADAEFTPVATYDRSDGAACDADADESCREGGLRFVYETDDLGAGQYEFRLRTSDGNGESNLIAFSEEGGSVTVDLLGAEGLAVNLQSDFDATLFWRVLPPTEGYRYSQFVVQRCTGTPEECADGPYQTLGAVDGQAGERTFTGAEANAPILLGPGNYAYRLVLRVVDVAGENEGETYVVTSDETFLTGADDFDFDGLALSPIYPNPATDRAAFNLTAETSQEVTVSLYNTLGQRVRQQRLSLSGGQAELVTIDGSRLPSGLYLVRVSGSSFDESRSVMFVR